MPLATVTSLQSCTQTPTPPFRSPSSTTPERSSVTPSVQISITVPVEAGASSPGYWDASMVSRVYLFGTTRTHVIAASLGPAAQRRPACGCGNPSPGSVQARPAAGTSGDEPRVVVQIRRIVLVLAAQNAMATNLAHRMPVSELGMGDIAGRALWILAPGTPVTSPVAGSLPGLSSWLQYCDHVRRFPSGCGHTSRRTGRSSRRGKHLPIDCRRATCQFQIAATRYASWVFDSRTSTISAGTSPRIPSAMIQFRISWSPESWISSGVSSASLLPSPDRTISR